MSRRHAAEKREVLPDAKFHDLVVSKFMNTLMRAGKKSVAERIVYGALETIERKTRQDPVRVFHEALDNVKPAIEVRSRPSAAPPTRCRSRFVRNAPRPWRCAGSSTPRASVPRTR